MLLKMNCMDQDGVAYKWLKRFAGLYQDGLEGLKNKHRSVRPRSIWSYLFFYMLY